jgi:hypothetical protein
VGDVKIEQLKGLTLLVVGSPTRAFRPSPAISGFLKSIPADGLKGVKLAAFDTRILESDIKPWILGLLVKACGYAAKPILGALTKKGGEAVVPPEGFAVEGKEGPLKPGELERAANWARRIASLCSSR